MSEEIKNNEKVNCPLFNSSFIDEIKPTSNTPLKIHKFSKLSKISSNVSTEIDFDEESGYENIAKSNPSLIKRKSYYTDEIEKKTLSKKLIMNKSNSDNRVTSKNEKYITNFPNSNSNDILQTNDKNNQINKNDENITKFFISTDNLVSNFNGISTNAKVNIASNLNSNSNFTFVKMNFIEEKLKYSSNSSSNNDVIINEKLKDKKANNQIEENYDYKDKIDKIDKYDNFNRFSKINTRVTQEVQYSNDIFDSSEDDGESDDYFFESYNFNKRNCYYEDYDKLKVNNYDHNNKNSNHLKDNDNNNNKNNKSNQIKIENNERKNENIIKEINETMMTITVTYLFPLHFSFSETSTLKANLNCKKSISNVFAADLNINSNYLSKHFSSHKLVLNVQKTDKVSDLILLIIKKINLENKIKLKSDSLFTLRSTKKSGYPNFDMPCKLFLTFRFE